MQRIWVHLDQVSTFGCTSFTIISCQSCTPLYATPLLQHTTQAHIPQDQWDSTSGWAIKKKKIMLNRSVYIWVYKHTACPSIKLWENIKFTFNNHRDNKKLIVVYVCCYMLEFCFILCTFIKWIGYCDKYIIKLTVDE